MTLNIGWRRILGTLIGVKMDILGYYEEEMSVESKVELLLDYKKVIYYLKTFRVKLNLNI